MPAHAQDQPAQRVKTCVVYTIQDLSPGAETAEFALPITASVSAAIEVSGFSMVPSDALGVEVQKRGLDPRALLGETALIAVARALNADLAVSGYYVVKEEQIFISLQCWDVQAGRLVTSMQEKARFNLAFYSFLHDHVADMVPHIQLHEQPTTAALPATARGPALTEIAFLSPDEGMEISIAGDLGIGTITDGKLLWRPDGLIQGTPLVVDKRKPGYHTSRQTVRALGEIRLSRLEKEHTLSVEADWTWGQLAGLGSAFRYYLKPDGIFLFVSAYPFVQPPLTAAGSPLYHADFSLGAGSYLFLPPDFPVRLGISSGMGVVATIPGSPVLPAAGDFYLNVINWWLETNILGPVIFLRQEWKFTLGVGTNYLGMQWMTAANLPPMTLGVMFRW
jgi:hypothetical protein